MKIKYVVAGEFARYAVVDDDGNLCVYGYVDGCKGLRLYGVHRLLITFDKPVRIFDGMGYMYAYCDRLAIEYGSSFDDIKYIKGISEDNHITVLCDNSIIELP